MDDIRIPIMDVAGPLAAFFDAADVLAVEIQNQLETGFLDLTILNDLQEFGEVYLRLMLGVNASLTERSRMFSSMMEFFTELSGGSNDEDETDNSA